MRDLADADACKIEGSGATRAWYQGTSLMPTDLSPAPVAARDRIATLDLLRGVAICGILLMNIPDMGMLTDDPGPALPARWNADWISWGVQKLLAEGTMRGLFEMLFGAGMLLVLRNAEGTHGKVAPFDVWARRCWALMGLGVVQWTLFLWPGEILWAYGVAGLFLLAFRVARPRTLLIAATILLTACSLYMAGQFAGRVSMLQQSIPAAAAKAAHKTLTAEQKAALDMVDQARAALHPTPKQTAKAYQKRTHIVSLEGWSWGMWQDLNMSPQAWVTFCEAVGFMLIGMLLFRNGVLTGDAPSRTYLRMIAIGYGGGLTLRGLSLLYGARTGYDLDIAQLSIGMSALRALTYQPARLLMTLGHVGLIVSLFRAGVLGKAWPARAMGRMALTVYSLQSILTSILFYGFGLVGQFGFAALMAISVGIWIVTSLFCMAWLTRFDMGPAEWVLRSIAYARLRPIRRADPDLPLSPMPAE